MKKCTGIFCPMQYGKVDPETCQAADSCSHATPPKTNADRIRAMGDTELAEFLWDVWKHKDPFYKECVDGWLVPFCHWLKQEAS